MSKEIKIPYISASSFSGSTLLSFLLNTHPDLSTIGPLVGWRFGANEEYLCSCGSPLNLCPLFTHIKDVFVQRDFSFAFNDFGTDYRLSSSDRMNRYLLGALPLARSPMLEGVRDFVVRAVPAWKRMLSHTDAVNRLFVDTVLERTGGKVFLDKSMNPYRLRLLRRVPGFRIFPIHLVRDFRGVVWSHIRRRGWTPEFAARKWIREQQDITYVLGEFPESRLIYYERLVDAIETELVGIESWMGLEPLDRHPDIQSVRHHILGNDMRVDVKTVIKDERWRDELTLREKEDIRAVAERFVRRNRRSPVARIVETYLAGGE